ncbi:MAG TPA: GntR family transcriptional regulator [Devosiaceae bacterium]|jgi:DNA-binding GntR family transcriptional regulator
MDQQTQGPAGDMTTMASRMMTALRDAIVRLELKPGDTISEAEIADKYGVSRQPVREAFIRLAQQGLLLIRPKRATLVKRIDVESIRHSRFIREAIEVEIVRRAAAEATAATGKLLEAVMADQDAAGKAGDLVRFHGLDELFHRSLAQTVGAEYAWQLVDDHKMQLDRLRFITLPSADPSRIVAEHRLIAKAVMAGDPAAAETALRDHLGKSEGLLLQARLDFPDYFA